MGKIEKASAVILGAGAGTRIGGIVKKQFVEINGLPVLFHSISQFEKSGYVGEIIVVVSKDDLAFIQSRMADQSFSKVSRVVAGGVERHDSVQKGLVYSSPKYNLVAIHDGVRPFVSEEKITQVIKAAGTFGAAILGVRPKNTIKQVADSKIDKTIDRQHLIEAQTPQVFRKEILRRAFDHAQKVKDFGTDDASLVEKINIPVHVVEGDYLNIKITSTEDLQFAKFIIGGCN